MLQTEPEPVTTDHHAVLKHHPVADPAELSNNSVRMRHKIVADPRSVIKNHVRMQDRVAANGYVVADHGVGSD